MTNTLAQWFADNWGSAINPYLLIFIVSMVPLVELRGALIVASLLQINLWTALPLCLLGNIIPVPFILLLIVKIFAWMKRHGILTGLVGKLEKRAMDKSDALEKGEFLGLLLFVGIPLPGTGAWTGSLIAALFGIDRKKAVLSIFLGLLLAAAIMSVFSYGILGNLL